MQLCQTISDIRTWRAQQLGRVALVPTMGALHAGHVALIEQAKQHADAVVVSVFVNPTQFGEGEDFEAYPRVQKQDAHICQEASVGVMFAPNVDDIYANARTNISVSGLKDGLCGQSRPHHFDGVATIVAILFNIIQPHVALFGEKDYQQCCIIRQMIHDLHLPIDMVSVPTLREADGLALSSRNRYLTKGQRDIAPKLHEGLQQARQDILSGAKPNTALAKLAQELLHIGFGDIDYLHCCDARTLEPINEHEGQAARLIAAVHLGNARLIDNIAL